MERLVLTSLTDETKISVMYLPVENPVAIIQICHGMCEHKERYIPFMEFLAEHHYITIIHDHRGHGESATSLKHLGYFGPKGAENLIEDAHLVTAYIKRHYPELPLYLFGHSMGSLIVRNYIQKYENEIKGLIVCGSPSYNQSALIGKGLTALMSKVCGPFYRSRLINEMAFGCFNHGIKNAISPHQWICNDEDIVRGYDDDPYCNFIFTVDGYHALFSLMIDAYHEKYYHCQNKNLPILFISGKEDPCLINMKKFNEAVSFIQKAGYQHVDSKLYPQMRHEILNERNHQQVFDDIVTWIKRLSIE